MANYSTPRGHHLIRVLRLVICLLLGIAPLSIALTDELDVLLIPYREVELSFQNAGQIKSILIKEGDRVKGNQLLAQLDSAEAELKLKQVNKVVEKNKFEADASKNLFDKNMMPETEYLEKKIEYDLSLIERDRNQSQLERRKILSPFSGQIVRLDRHEAEWVEPGQPVMTLLDNSKVYAEALLPRQLRSAFQVGQELQLRVPEASLTITGKVEFIDPRVDPTSHLTRCKILIDNDREQLSPGMTGSLQYSR